MINVKHINFAAMDSSVDSWKKYKMKVVIEKPVDPADIRFYERFRRTQLNGWINSELIYTGRHNDNQSKRFLSSVSL